MTAYQKGKERARERAKEWQYAAADRRDSYGELVEAADRFRRLAERFGLIREFRENGII